MNNSTLFVEPTQEDVLLGRGVGVSRHPGNLVFRMVVERSKELYYRSKRKEKSAIALSIVEALETQMPPTRFLSSQKTDMMSTTERVWTVVSKERAIRKTEQALREKPKKGDAPLKWVLVPSNKGTKKEIERSRSNENESPVIKDLDQALKTPEQALSNTSKDKCEFKTWEDVMKFSRTESSISSSKDDAFSLPDGEWFKC